MNDDELPMPPTIAERIELAKLGARTIVWMRTEAAIDRVFGAGLAKERCEVALRPNAYDKTPCVRVGEWLFTAGGSESLRAAITSPDEGEWMYVEDAIQLAFVSPASEWREREPEASTYHTPPSALLARMVPTPSELLARIVDWCRGRAA